MRNWTCRRESGFSQYVCCWVDKDDYHTAKSRLTARGYEQELTGQENLYSATPQPATLRVFETCGSSIAGDSILGVLVLAQALGLTVAVGCAVVVCSSFGQELV